jgi:hypothetical protein
MVSPLVHGQALDLVEDRAVGGVERVAAEALARAHHVQRQRAGQHRPDLYRRGVGAQHHPGPIGAAGPRDEERVLHLAGRVIGREVERVEVVPLGLGLGPLGDLVAHRDEHVGQPLRQRGHRVPGTLAHPAPGQA